ncbi:hypothetical protein [uncultured Helicobacter sp.]|uniref:hypothetical protein n=1 Tax=uncultured Helicobacter sp. TaxID=175537 RepID=UPI001C3A02DF|nr:hypothetical protein [Candidatus Helicobacter avicola]
MVSPQNPYKIGKPSTESQAGLESKENLDSRFSNLDSESKQFTESASKPHQGLPGILRFSMNF